MIGELLLMLRGVPEANAKGAPRECWSKQAVGSFEARGKSWASSVAATSVPSLAFWRNRWGMHVFFYDIENKLPLGNATQVQHLRPAEHERCGQPARAGKRLYQKYDGCGRTGADGPGALLINASRGTVGGHSGAMRCAGQ